MRKFRGSLLAFLKKVITPSKLEKKSGNFHVMQRWSDESGRERRLPLGALICSGDGKIWDSGAINHQVSEHFRALSRPTK